MDISLVFFVEKDLMILFHSGLIVLTDKSHNSHKYFSVDELFPVWGVTKEAAIVPLQSVPHTSCFPVWRHPKAGTWPAEGPAVPTTLIIEHLPCSRH